MWKPMSWKTACCFLLAVAVQAQSPMPVGIVRGKLVSSIGTNRAGEITVRGADGLASCNYDARTYFEREFEMIHANALAPGDPVEVLADRRPGSTACYARTVQVTNRRPQLYVPGGPKSGASSLVGPLRWPWWPVQVSGAVNHSFSLPIQGNPTPDRIRNDARNRRSEHPSLLDIALLHENVLRTLCRLCPVLIQSQGVNIGGVQVGLE